jgi:hypothetical protein
MFDNKRTVNVEDYKYLFRSSKLLQTRDRLSSKYIDSKARALKMFYQHWTALSQSRRRVGTIWQLTERNIHEDFYFQRPRCDNI